MNIVNNEIYVHVRKLSVGIYSIHMMWCLLTLDFKVRRTDFRFSAYAARISATWPVSLISVASESKYTIYSTHAYTYKGLVK